MSIMRRLLGLWMASLALMLALLSGPAHSNVSIPSGTNASNDLVLNFDLSSLLPSGYTNFIDIIVEYSFSSPDAGGGNGSGGCCLVPVTMDFFSGLNGGGSLLQTSSVGIRASCCIPPQLTSSNSGLIDGIFSIGVRVGPGVTATLNGVTAAGFYIAYAEPNSGTGDRDVTTSPVAGTLVTPATVPEPATLVLVGLGLSSLVMTRRRWR